MSTGMLRKSTRTVTERTAARRHDVAGDGPSQMTVYRYFIKANFKPFYVVNRPYKNVIHQENRLLFCDYLHAWEEKDFMHLAYSDEFYVWLFQKTNYQNDRVWPTD